MKRVLLSVVGTVVGLVALLDFKTHGHPIAGALPGASLPGAGTSTSTSTGAASTDTAGAGPNPSSSTTPKSSTSSSSHSAATTKKVDGTAVETQYGIVQVEVTTRGSTITNVQFLQLTAFDQRSQEINSAAAPILLQETIKAQNSNIDTVSGATFTSEGYIQSLQSALDQVGIK